MNLSKNLYKKTERLKVGDPLSDDTDIGPVVNAKSLENMEGIVNRTLKEGAELLTGGERMKNKGYFFAPTILKNVLPTYGNSTRRSVWSCCSNNYS